MAEIFFATLKTEFYYRRIWPTRTRAIQGAAESIEDRYNRRRRHSSIGQVTLVDFEMQHSSQAAEIQLAAQPVSTLRGQGQGVCSVTAVSYHRRMVTVTVATWNVENLFAPNSEFGPTSAAAFEEKIARLVMTIRASSVDILALQEVGDQQAFDHLLTALGAGWIGRLSTHFEPRRAIRVGFVTRLRIDSFSEQVEIPPLLSGVPINDAGDQLTEMGRGALHIRVDVGGHAVDLVSVHLKSKLISYPGGRFQPRNEAERARYGAYALLRRAAEAAAVRGLADTLLDGEGETRNLIVMGDFNDTVDAATTQLIQGPSGSEIGTRGENRPDAGDKHRLWNLAPLIPEERRFSRVFRGRPELIDHLFISRALGPTVQSVTTIVGDDAPLPSITEEARERKNEPASDHSMVAVTLTLP